MLPIVQHRALKMGAVHPYRDGERDNDCRRESRLYFAYAQDHLPVIRKLVEEEGEVIVTEQGTPS